MKKHGVTLFGVAPCCFIVQNKLPLCFVCTLKMCITQIIIPAKNNTAPITDTIFICENKAINPFKNKGIHISITALPISFEYASISVTFL